LTGGPVGAAIGAVGGAIIGAAAERMMHADEPSVERPPDSLLASGQPADARPSRDPGQHAV
jgi:hypothetical protein